MLGADIVHETLILASSMRMSVTPFSAIGPLYIHISHPNRCLPQVFKRPVVRLAPGFQIRETRTGGIVYQLSRTLQWHSYDPALRHFEHTDSRYSDPSNQIYDLDDDDASIMETGDCSPEAP